MRNLIKSLFRSIGLDVRLLKLNPRETLAGLNVRPVKLIIDCGANEGQFGQYIANIYPDAEIHCFEPLSEPFSKLEAWASSMHGRIHCHRTALGSHIGEATIYYHVDHSASSSMLATTTHKMELYPETAKQRAIQVPLTTLDDSLSDKVRSIDGQVLLKLDLQGYEEQVLKGATQVLDNVDICLLEVCIDPLYESQASFSSLVALLTEHSFRYAGNLEQTHGEDGRVMWLDALFLKE